MKHTLSALLTFLAFMGAGCASRATSTIPSQKNPPFSGTENRPPSSTQPTVNLCNDPGRENGAGAIVFPIDPKYQRFPHLGQIFTAMDCQNQQRITVIRGMKNALYVPGIRLRWENGNDAPKEFADLLTQLRFIQVSPGVWENKNPLSLDELNRLKPFFENNKIRGGLESEDCIICG